MKRVDDIYSTKSNLFIIWFFTVNRYRLKFKINYNMYSNIFSKSDELYKKKSTLPKLKRGHVFLSDTKL